MRDLHFLEGSERTEYLLQNTNDLISLEPIFVVLPLRQKLLQIDLRAFHDDECVLLLVILVPLHLGEEVAVVLNEPLAELRQLLHEGDLLQEALVLVVVLYLDLLQGVGLALYVCDVDVGVAAAQLLLDADVAQLEIALQNCMVCEKIKHLTAIIITNNNLRDYSCGV